MPSPCMAFKLCQRVSAFLWLVNLLSSKQSRPTFLSAFCRTTCSTLWLQHHALTPPRPQPPARLQLSSALLPVYNICFLWATVLLWRIHLYKCIKLMFADLGGDLTGLQEKKRLRAGLRPQHRVC